MDSVHHNAISSSSGHMWVGKVYYCLLLSAAHCFKIENTPHYANIIQKFYQTLPIMLDLHLIMLDFVPIILLKALFLEN